MALDPRTPVTDIERLNHELTRIWDRINDLAAPSGTEAYQSVKKLSALVADIQAQLDEYLSNDAYTKAQVDARITNPGLVGPVVTATSARFDAGLASTGAYNELLSGSGGTIRALWIHPDGRLGYLPSDAGLKVDVRPARFELDDVLKLQAVFFEYMARVPYDQAQEPTYLGALAQEVADAGFTWLVDYDSEGKPAGVHHAFGWLVVLEGLRALAAETRG